MIVVLLLLSLAAVMTMNKMVNLEKKKVTLVSTTATQAL